MSADLIIGSFTLSKSDNFDAFMKALGVGMVMRKMGGAATPTVTFSKAGDLYTFKTITSIKTTEVSFEIGKPFTETTLDGREATTTFTLDGAVLTQVQKAAKGPDATYIRTFTSTELITVCQADGVSSTRTYKKN